MSLLAHYQYPKGTRNENSYGGPPGGAESTHRCEALSAVSRLFS
jgi:hypothetical protein